MRDRALSVSAESSQKIEVFIANFDVIFFLELINKKY